MLPMWSERTTHRMAVPLERQVQGNIGAAARYCDGAS